MKDLTDVTYDFIQVILTRVQRQCTPLVILNNSNSEKLT